LAKRGHQVALSDLSPTLLVIAHTKVAESPVAANAEAIVEAEASNLLRWPDGTFDAVLALGPLYHLTDPEDRHQAMSKLPSVPHSGTTPRFCHLHNPI
jgi:2-polyprenyl-3-methyl-5-hydroxy-6-metoxy-1,4-benzoquinol methylase